MEKGVATILKGQSTRGEIIAFKDGTDLKEPLIVLVNGESASASEIVAAALGDYERAILIGERTYGKGTVQEIDELKDGGALKLTVSEYVSPNQKPINKRGVLPDYQLSHPPAQLDLAKSILRANTTITFRSPESLLLNGEPLINHEKVARYSKGHWYISLNSLKQFYGLNINWYEAFKGIEIENKGKRHILSIKDATLFVKDGQSYLKLRELVKLFSSFKLKINNNKVLELTYKK
jgi:carboxyl-terminal processing protease